jgi:sister chromatid cohesion protein DCC1
LTCIIQLIRIQQGNYLLSNTNWQNAQTLTYFPASTLPTDPGARFGALFAVRAKWSANDIEPFLSDIAVNGKERDKLLLKFCRTVREDGKVLYTARATYVG